jgi:hypothetical protein
LTERNIKKGRVTVTKHLLTQKDTIDNMTQDALQPSIAGASKVQASSWALACTNAQDFKVRAGRA